MTTVSTTNTASAQIAPDAYVPEHPERVWTDYMAAEDQGFIPGENEVLVFRGFLAPRKDELLLGEATGLDPTDDPLPDVDESELWADEGWHEDPVGIERRLWLEMESEYKRLLKLPRDTSLFQDQLKWLMGPEGMGWAVYLVEGVLRATL